MSITVDYASPAGTSGLTVYFSVERASDGFYFDTSDSVFKIKASITPGDEQISLPEDADEDGRYLATLATVNPLYWTDGNYSCIIRNDAGDVLLAIDKKYLKDQQECSFRLNSI